MERIPGVDLRRRIQRDGPLTPEQVAFLGFDLAEGLHFVHEHGFLHRDIKPANVLLADRGMDTRLRGKLADFGIASIIGANTSGSRTTGTAAYLSPEQADDQDPTSASDVYSLGLVLLEALTGFVAFPGTALETTLARIDRDPVIPAAVPPRLADLLRQMTALLPEDRPDLPTIALEFQAISVQHLIDAGARRPRAAALGRGAATRDGPPLQHPRHPARRRVRPDHPPRVPTARRPRRLIGIVDADREWFKSHHGIEVREIDRDQALCATTIATGEPFVVEDVQREARFVRNPIVQADPSLHAFAAVPLRTADGTSIGTPARSTARSGTSRRRRSTTSSSSPPSRCVSSTCGWPAAGGFHRYLGAAAPPRRTDGDMN